MEESQQVYPTLTEEQFQIIEEERELHLAGLTKSYTREEANEMIRNKGRFEDNE